MSFWDIFESTNEEQSFNLNEMPTPEFIEQPRSPYFYEEPATEFEKQPKFQDLNEYPDETNLNKVNDVFF